MKYIIYITASLLLFYVLPSCRKFVEVEPPIDKLNAGVVFMDVETATAAVVGLYVNMMSTFSPEIASGGVTVYMGLASDELYNSNPGDVTQSEFSSNAVSSANQVVKSNFWFRGFNIIYQANACIEGLENNTYLPVQTRDQLLGEAYFCRAFFYYYFVNLFGDVPLLLKTDYIENQKAARTPTVKVNEQIIADLKKAQILLSTYPTDGRVRPNKWTATALLAREYLTLGQWALAEQEASSIINSGDFALEPNLNDVFLATSNEAIWQIMPVTGYNTLEGFTFVPASWNTGLPDFLLTNYLLDSIEPDDLRKNNWVASKTVDGIPYYYPFKYKVNSYGMPLTEYYMVFRLSEQYLIRAECYAHEENIDEAKVDLNMIRHRAGLPDATVSTSDELLTAIGHERRIELFAEWGHRWFDLKRTGRSTEVLAGIKPDWQPTDTLLPIPLEEIQHNPALTQNPGY